MHEFLRGQAMAYARCSFFSSISNTVTDILSCINLSFQSLAVSLRTTRFKMQKFYMVLTLLWVFCTYLRTDSDILYSINWLVFYNRGGKCLLRGTN